jgi:hypothetical protein
MNTLDKIAKLESEVSMIKQLIASVPSDAQTLSSVNQNVAILAQNQKENAEKTNKIFSMVGQKQDLVVQRIMSIEQAIASLGKMLQAVLGELSDNHNLSYDNVQTRIRKYDESQEAVRIKQMLEFGSIKKVEEVSADSTVVVAQSFALKGTGQVSTVAEYRVYELSSPLNSKEDVDLLVGKKVGDVVTTELADGTLSTTILEIYQQNEVNINENVQDSVS